ncbi:MAG: hypothetical protein Fur0021_34100 [Candidatus Promineifilaceae bacterium]
MIISQAQHIGRGHRLMCQNNQDYATTGQPAVHTSFGIVLDGCGSKYGRSPQATPSANEVGARLLGQFLSGWLQSCDLEQAADELIAHLHQATVTFLTQLTAAMPLADSAARAHFVATQLLCTVVGFVARPQDAVFFWLGDGYLCLNEEVISLESGNRPDYLAYTLLDNQPRPFNALCVRQRAALTRLAVASDGWQPDLLRQLRQPLSGLALQRWVSQQAQQRGQFEDDGAIAICWLKGEET